MTSQPNALTEILKQLRVALIGDTIHVYCEETAKQVEQQIFQRMRKTGEGVRWPDGRRQWIDHEPVLDFTRQASEMYTWDKSGNRVLNEVALYTLFPDGRRERTVIGKSYRSFLAD